ncbi:MAG: GlcNAc-PI de-N-acetylase [Bacteroidetes bacterium GWE2_41_25]|nr:MAG: GlcNAc-PI de-N-acetylase [Bacteroidetes bacterium GWA2_40_15]OFX92003.1 MAG: GlcNAc-PI de-N-acetylase [Bacteroidetes bacterium GWE2_41_25]OFX95255.1 MAG: GlcNAc-PI de-N-acetylase [Bacteroidetes bacterium GWC2_40_22]HAM11044.1 GlcNAc-PI de-N-acetylase [Bacteroidales bacterium]HBH82326.1 GlcNAc-PI de-N-acetylase [Bacteroidales bacterium]
MKTILSVLVLLLVSLFPVNIQAQAKAGEKLHIIIIGAHPDDPDKVGGTAYKWAQAGHDVLMVSVTNGDAGHQSIKAAELASIRRIEARKAGEVIGIRYITLDNHDGQLMPTYENRLQVIRVIREHNADMVIFPRPYDYHPDHRYTGVLVLDAAYMVTVPTILPEVPHLKRNPMFLFMSDGFIHPEPFTADVCIDIDDVIEKKIDMYHQHTSQMYEWLPYNKGNLDQVPASEKDRRKWLGETRKGGSDAKPYREKLIELYGKERGSAIKYCEAFQDSGYGVKLTKENMKVYFPFLK